MNQMTKRYDDVKIQSIVEQDNLSTQESTKHGSSKNQLVEECEKGKNHDIVDIESENTENAESDDSVEEMSHKRMKMS